MASSGSFNTSSYAGRYLTFAWSIKSQDVATNKTVINWSLTGAGGDSTWYKSGNFKVVIAGVTVYSSATRIQLSKGTVVKSGTHTLVHNADGSKSFTASAEAGIYTTAVNCTGSGSFTLDTIPRASQPSLVTWPETTNDVGYFGEEFSIHMNRKSDVFTHTVRYAYGSRTGTIATGVTTGTTWAVPLSFMNDIPNATSASGRIYVDTYNGSTKVGTKYTGFTVKVPASVKPTCTVQVLDATDIQKTYGNLVKGLSKLYVKVNGYTAYGSPIVSRSATANGGSYTAEEFTTGVLKAAGTTTVTATVKDKRGRVSAAASASFTVLDYALPSIGSLNVRRCNEDGTENEQGEYVRAVFSAAITALNNKNTATYKLRYKKSTASSFTEVTLSDLANVYTVSGEVYIFPADSSSSYDVELEATDNHGTTTRSTSASTAFTLMNWGADGRSIGLLKVAEKTGAVDIGGDVYLEGHALYGAHGMIDTRSTNETPEWYMTNHGRGTVWEFKELAVIGFTDPATKFSPVQTIIPWKDASGGLPRQVAYEGRTRWTRVANSATAWGAWQSDALIAYPVGSIYLAYNHTNPGTLFGGTWARISNAFLWAADSSGTIGQTGGEKTHTLTVAELPQHDHGGTYTNAGTSRTHAWLASNGSAMGYDSVSAGSGQPHNNMPPFIQVSIWRRTA